MPHENLRKIKHVGDGETLARFNWIVGGWERHNHGAGIREMGRKCYDVGEPRSGGRSEMLESGIERGEG